MPLHLPILLSLLAALLAQPTATKRESAVDRTETIKAGMILNFIRYTDWPEGSFASEDGPIVVAAVGDGPMITQVEQAVESQKAHGRPIEFHRLKYPEPVPGETAVSETALQEFYQKLRASHVVCIGRSEAGRADTVLRTLGASSVLTVSDIDDFAPRGGMLGLAVRRERVAFDANQRKIEETKLKVSSQVLRLAQIVESKETSK